MNLLALDEISTPLQAGAVGIIPTDTLYGLSSSALNPSAVAKMYHIKQRENKPGTLIAASIDQLVELGIPRRYLTPVAHLWPNPLSIVVPANDSLAFLHLGLQSLAIRIPNDPNLLRILEQTGPLATTSANMPGEPFATTVQQAYDIFGETVDFYVDGGDYSNHAPSTVVRVVDDAIEVLREGAISIT